MAFRLPTVSASRVFRGAWLLQGLLFLWLAQAHSPAVAQGLGVLSGGDESDPLAISRSRVNQTASRSFGAYLEKATRDVDADGGLALAETADRLRSRFDAALANTLDDLEGDGLLTAAEVEKALGDLRRRYEQEVDTIVSAIRDGYPPPPLLQGVKSTGEHLRELFHYTLMVRNPPRSWLTFLAFFIGGLVFAWAINRGARELGQRISTGGLPGPGSLLRSLAGPLYLAALAFSLELGLSSIWIPASVSATLYGLVRALLVGAFFWFLWSASPSAATGIMRLIDMGNSRRFDAHAHNILLRSIRVLILVGLMLVIVRLILGTSLNNVLAGLGIIGVAMYFVLRRTIENVAASFTLFSDQPFRVGDMIIYDSQWGTVEDIGFRSTQFRTFDGHLVTIPNSELLDGPIENAGARPSIRRRFHVGLRYDTSPEKAREAVEIIADILSDYEGMPRDQPANVVLSDLGEHALGILVQYYYAPPDYWDALDFDMEVNLAILERFRDAGIAIAFPTETLRLEGEEDGNALPLRTVVAGESEEEPGEETKD